MIFLYLIECFVGTQNTFNDDENISHKLFLKKNIDLGKNKNFHFYEMAKSC